MVTSTERRQQKPMPRVCVFDETKEPWLPCLLEHCSTLANADFGQETTSFNRSSEPVLAHMYLEVSGASRIARRLSA